MALYPSVQEKAQAELDKAVGRGRLPNCADLDSLPYVKAVVKELVRWHPVVPIGVPHTTTHDDEFQGYFIPKGAVIIANLW